MVYRFGQVFLVALCLAACATPRVNLMTPIPSEPQSAPQLTVMTWNAAQAPGVVRLANPRLSAAAAALAARDYDIVCLQEVWTDQARDTFVAALGLPPENVYYVDTHGEGESGGDKCRVGDIREIIECANRECANEPRDEMTTCVVERCVEAGTHLFFNHRRCLNCLASCAGQDVESVLNTCVRGQGASRLYGGRNGVILASRWPLLNKGSISLPSSGANRVILFATVRLPTGEEVEIGCTHLSADNLVPPTNPAFTSWADEQQAQLRLIAEQLASRAGPRPQLLIGDLNFGQRHEPNIGPMMWSSWRVAADLGFASPGEYAEPSLCSWCRSNRLARSGVNHLIDHALLRNPKAGTQLEPIGAFRVFDQPLFVVNQLGRRVLTHLSDHYGIVVQFVFR